MEKRFFDVSANKESESMTINGKFICFNEITNLTNDIYEQISDNAINMNELGDVKALFNHETGKVIGSLSNGTLRLSKQSDGIYAEIDLPNTTYGRDLFELIKRGDINKCSFGFSIEDEKSEPYSNGFLFTIRKLKLHEISVVTFPAYSGTSVSARDVAGLKEEFFKKRKESILNEFIR